MSEKQCNNLIKPCNASAQEGKGSLQKTPSVHALQHTPSTLWPCTKKSTVLRQELVWKMFLWCRGYQTFTSSTAKTVSLHHGTCFPAMLLLLQGIYGQTSASKEDATKKKHPKNWHSKSSRGLILFCKMHIFRRKDHVLRNKQKHCNMWRGGRKNMILRNIFTLH